MTKLTGPEFLWRIDDKEILRRNADDTYSFINSEMNEPYRYTYETLMVANEGYFASIPPEINIVNFLAREKFNDGPGYPVRFIKFGINPDIIDNSKAVHTVLKGNPPYESEPEFDRNGRWIASSITAETYSRIVADSKRQEAEDSKFTTQPICENSVSNDLRFSDYYINRIRIPKDVNSEVQEAKNNEENSSN